MTPVAPESIWSEQALFGKALLYSEQMESHSVEEWQFGLWSALSLEFLARAALAHISPVLVADNKDWENLFHALGKSPINKKFSPKSLSTGAVFLRLSKLIPEFNHEKVAFCLEHIGRRNAELHSGELSFSNLRPSEWLSKFYFSCQELLSSMNKDLSDFISEPITAQEMIDSLKDTAAKAVQQDIKAHKQVWSNKNEEEQNKAILQADAWATRQAGHRVHCPSCNANALVQGTPSGPVQTQIDEDDELIKKQTFLPSSFECIACELRITGFSKLSACGLGDAFTGTSIHSPAEFFDLYTQEDLDDMRAELEYDIRYEYENEMDFNE